MVALAFCLKRETRDLIFLHFLQLDVFLYWKILLSLFWNFTTQMVGWELQAFQDQKGGLRIYSLGLDMICGVALILGAALHFLRDVHYIVRQRSSALFLSTLS